MISLRRPDGLMTPLNGLSMNGIDMRATLSEANTGQETDPVPNPRLPDSDVARLVPLALSVPAWIPLVWAATKAWRTDVPTAFVHYDYPSIWQRSPAFRG